jgi:3'-phosphoadenosine 5'-phosphosulfate (PAPS) 3'-phosphatase
LINQDSALLGIDYAEIDPLSGTLNFAEGEASRTVTVGLVDDDSSEPMQSLTLDLSNPVNATAQRANRDRKRRRSTLKSLSTMRRSMTWRHPFFPDEGIISAAWQ